MKTSHRVAITLVGLLVLTYLAAADTETVAHCSARGLSACPDIAPQAMVNLRP